MLGLNDHQFVAGVLLGGFFGLFAGRRGAPGAAGGAAKGLRHRRAVYHGPRRRDSGRRQPGLQHPGSRLGLRHHRSHDRLTRQGLHLLRHPGICAGGSRHAPGPTADPDGAGGLISLADRLDFDLLRGVNLVWSKLLRVANMLPTIIFAIAFSYLPWSF